MVLGSELVLLLVLAPVVVLEYCTSTISSPSQRRSTRVRVPGTAVVPLSPYRLAEEHVSCLLLFAEE